MKTFCLLLSLCLSSSASAYNFGVGTSAARSVAVTSNGAAELAAAPKPSYAFDVFEGTERDSQLQNVVPSGHVDLDKPTTISHRRAFLSKIAGATIAAAATTLSPNSASAAEEDNLQNVYWGAGCYWHVQHELILAERSILGRKDDELTSLTGYAGGFKTDAEGRVCYHNFQSIADYGKLGHGEVVGMTIPESKIEDFAVEYFKLFSDKGERADPMDKGGEYRSLLGLPGGSKHPAFPQVEAAGKARGMTLVDGKGNDPDTLGKRLVYVYDSNKFPFYQAEFYHQYHNDFLTPAYGKEYNNLANAALEDGRIKITGCPDRVKATSFMNSVKQNEALVLTTIAGVGAVSIVIFAYILWIKPRYLHMPIYENYEKVDEGIAETEIV